MKIYTQGEDGWTQYIWEMDDFTMESNEEWWKGQVDFNDHRVSNSKNNINIPYGQSSAKLPVILSPSH